MRIHINTADSAIIDAMTAAVEAGQVSPFVQFDELIKRRSRSHRAAFEVRLVTHVKREGEKRYRPNSGSIGYDGTPVWAATWHEWGWFLAHLFNLDPSAKAGPYRGAGEFHAATDGQFRRTEVAR